MLGQCSVTSNMRGQRLCNSNGLADRPLLQVRPEAEQTQCQQDTLSHAKHSNGHLGRLQLCLAVSNILAQALHLLVELLSLGSILLGCSLLAGMDFLRGGLGLCQCLLQVAHLALQACSTAGQERWADWYITRLLIKLSSKGVVLFYFLFSQGREK